MTQLVASIEVEIRQYRQLISSGIVGAPRCPMTERQEAPFPQSPRLPVLMAMSQPTPKMASMVSPRPRCTKVPAML